MIRLLVLVSITTWAFCIQANCVELIDTKHYMYQAEILACRTVIAFPDLLIKVKLVDKFQLGVPTILVEDAGGLVEEFVYLSDEQANCIDIVGITIYGRKVSNCCDVMPHTTLTCIANLQSFHRYTLPKNPHRVPANSLHLIEFRKYLIGDDEPFTGTAVHYYPNTNIVEHEIAYTDGISGNNISWDREGVILGQRIVMGDDEIVRNFDHGRLRGETRYYNRVTKDLSKAQGYVVKKWDNDGVLVSCESRNFQKTTIVAQCPRDALD